MIFLRTIRKNDNKAIQDIVTKVMTEFDCSGPGFSIHDQELYNMYDAYNQEGHIYYIVEMNDVVLGGGGIGTLPGEDKICELKKMYFLPELRGKGAAGLSMQKLISFAKEHYSEIYIETTNQMADAQRVYQKFNFKEIPNSLGNTGHFGCDRFYLLRL